MPRRRTFIENKTYRFNGKQYKAIDLIDSLYLRGVEIEEIARILKVEEEPFISDYQERLNDLRTIHESLMIKALHDKAMNGDQTALDQLLTKYGWLDKEEQSSDFISLLREAAKKSIA